MSAVLRDCYIIFVDFTDSAAPLEAIQVSTLYTCTHYTGSAGWNHPSKSGSVTTETENTIIPNERCPFTDGVEEYATRSVLTCTSQ